MQKTSTLKNNECDCFLCTHKDNPDILYGYNEAQIKFCEQTLYYLRSLGFVSGNLASEGKSIETLMSILECELDEAYCTRGEYAKK